MLCWKDFYWCMKNIPKAGGIFLIILLSSARSLVFALNLDTGIIWCLSIHSLCFLVVVKVDQHIFLKNIYREWLWWWSLSKMTILKLHYVHRCFMMLIFLDKYKESKKTSKQCKINFKCLKACPLFFKIITKINWNMKYLMLLWCFGCFN